MSTDEERVTPASPAEIEADIVRRREHLAATVDELLQRAKPRQIARRSALGVRRGLVEATHTADGELRTERIAAVAGAVLVVVTLVALLRRRLHRAD